MSDPIVIFDDMETRIDESPFSASTTDNWVARLGGLPPYIRGVTRGVMKSGHSFTDALKIAIGVMHIWAEGRNPWSPHHTGHVTPATQAKAQAALAHWEQMKGEAAAGMSKKREVEFSHIRDGGSFVGESGSAGLFLPAGPSNKQDEDIHKKETAKPHRFRGDNLSSCDQCGQGITAAVHRSGGKAAAQPIPPVPRQATLIRESTGVRHRGPDHAPVSSGHVKGVPTRHKKAAYAMNLKNFGIAEGPLEEAMKAHFEEQHRATINRLMGKRGKRMLKRASERLVLGAGYPDAVPPHYPLPGDNYKTTTEPNTTSPVAEVDFNAEIAAEQAQAKQLTNESAAPRLAVDIDPQDIFDQNFWANKLTSILQPHLHTSATLAQAAVRSQAAVPHDVDDSTAIAAVQNALGQRAQEAARAITSTTAKELADALQKGVAHGEDGDAISDRVSGVFHRALSQRAGQIAQTQTVGNYNEAATHYAVNLPAGTVGNKVWVAHADDNVRPAHRMADNQERPLNMPYIVGAHPMHFPGDTQTPLKEWINCRCSQAFLPSGMSYGPLAHVAKAYAEAWHVATPAPVSPYMGTPY